MSRGMWGELVLLRSEALPIGRLNVEAAVEQGVVVVVV